MYILLLSDYYYNVIMLGLPFNNVSAESGKKADHCEAQFICTTQHESRHDGNQGQLDVDAVPLSEQQP